MKTKITIAIICAFTIFSEVMAQQTYSFIPIKDASIGFHDNYNSANNNYGSAIYYGAFSQPGFSGGENAGMGLMMFDLSQFPAGTIISDARLNLYGCGPFGGGDVASIGDVGKNASRVERITTPWEEFTVTYNTQPLVTYQNFVKLKASNSVDQDYLDIDVTALTQDMIDEPLNSYGFRIRLRNEEPNRGLAFWSTDGPFPDEYPTLTITLGENLIGSNSKDDHSTIARTLVYPNPFSITATIQLQQSYSGDGQVLIFDSFGRLVSQFTTPLFSTINIERGNLVNGFYQFAIVQENRIVERGKFVIQ
jgi:hypothetical protein